MIKITAEQLSAYSLAENAAHDMAVRVNKIAASCPAPDCWHSISKEILEPDHPFDVHKFLYNTCFKDWNRELGPPPAWIPDANSSQITNIEKLMAELKIDCYRNFHKWSASNRADFWETMIKRLKIPFRKKYKSVMNLSAGPETPLWLDGAELNIADACFLGADSGTAIIYQPEGEDVSKTTYKELELLCNRVANGLVNLNYGPGDAIACYMPMTMESVAIYLGIVKAGCAVVSIADSFAPDEVRKRLQIANTKGVFTQDFIMRADKCIPLYEKIVEANGPKAIVLPCGKEMKTNLRDMDATWHEFLSDNDKFMSVGRSPGSCTNILFSSGTTGDPKAIPWTQTTPIKCAVDGYLHHDIRPNDVVAWPTNLGWMMGPWLIYASLINRGTIALYYGAPTGREFTKFVQDARVNMLGVIPSLVKAWRNTNCIAGLDWSSIRAFSSTGECSNTDDMLFLMASAGYKPIIEYCGGTEIGGGYITGTVVQPSAPSTFSTPALGLDFVVLDEKGEETDNGEVFLKPPSIGLSNELLNMDHHEVYYKDVPVLKDGALLRRHGDQIECLSGGYYRAHGRADDTMNLGGIKVSSAEIERTLNHIKGISETAAIAVTDQEDGPEKLVVYVVSMPGVELNLDQLKQLAHDELKKHLNPLFKIHDMIIVKSLPRTASNKVMRRALRAAYTENL